MRTAARHGASVRLAVRLCTCADRAADAIVAPHDSYKRMNDRDNRAGPETAGVSGFTGGHAYHLDGRVTDEHESEVQTALGRLGAGRSEPCRDRRAGQPSRERVRVP